jgi:hypothetical protein
MNKLTEIKRQYEGFTKDPKTYVAMLSMEELGYLLSLLEEKDKALAFYADEKLYEQELMYFDDEQTDSYFEAPDIMDDHGTIARKALNTSSNNEGEK